ncbi:hypothetical protein FHS49_000925 [Sphingobium boeckii]|uniref:Uncharacterized protein n=1 Tax=Sphingobium boeckii TaxID=1082345 RepID=A0A7W9EDH4_9SPHN|nr:hypothetical protein [Sphingobium boeckii]
MRERSWRMLGIRFGSADGTPAADRLAERI